MTNSPPSPPPRPPQPPSLGPLTASAALDPDSGARVELAAAVVEAVDTFLDELDHSPASYPAHDDRLIDALLQPPPEHGAAAIDPLLATVLTAARTGFDTASGGHLSYIPNGGLYSAALGRFMAAALNRFVGASFAQPGMVALEQSVIDWMIDVFGLGPSAAGLLVSGGSMATLEAVVTARSQMGDRFDDAVVYTSERAHHSVAKAARLAGIPTPGLRSIPTDDQLRLCPLALERSIAGDRAAGLRPMLVVATAGTTDTGAIDPLGACADISAEHGLWLHVDAAYGGFFALTERGRARLAGIERADSITVDAHKTLFVPYGVGGLLVADGATLIDAHEGRGAYLRDGTDHGRLPNYFAMGAELSRPCRGLDVWLPLHLHGVGAFRHELDRMLDLAQTAAGGLSHLPGVELVSDPTLSIVAFHCTAGDVATTAVLDHLNDSGEVHVSSTAVRGRTVIRLAFLNPRTTIETVDRVVDLVADVMAGPSPADTTPIAA